MKKIICLAAVAVFFTSLKAQTADTTKKNVDKYVSFTNADYDMGKIPAGRPLEYHVVIKNISKETIVLEDVKAGCGCTTPKFRAGERLLPGKGTFITLGFNGGANGEFMKTADIIFSGGLTKQLKFHGVAVTDSSSNIKPGEVINN